MAAVQNVDNYTGMLTALYTTGVSTTLTVSTATGLPADGAANFDLTVAAEAGNTREVFHVTNKAGTVLTVTGAQENTVGSNHNIGAVVTGQTIGSNYLAQIATPQVQNNVSGGSRVFGTVYQNTGKNAMIISVGGFTATASLGNIEALTDSSNPPTTGVAQATVPFTNGLANITFVVLPGNFYKVTATFGSPTLVQWFEWQ